MSYVIHYQFCPSDLSNLGLIFDIIGCFLIWRFGLPADVDRHGNVVFAAIQKDEEEIQKGKRYDLSAVIGFVFLVVGFSLQVAGNILSRNAYLHPNSTTQCIDPSKEEPSLRPNEGSLPTQ